MGALQRHAGTCMCPFNMKRILMIILAVCLQSIHQFVFAEHVQKNQQLRSKRSNILMVVVDNLRPSLSVYTNGTEAQTPHIDALAKDGILFTRAYCQEAWCGRTFHTCHTFRQLLNYFSPLLCRSFFFQRPRGTHS